MHDLAVIHMKNAYAAGREQAHEDRDLGRDVLTTLEQGILESTILLLHTGHPTLTAYLRGYQRGQDDDVVAGDKG